MSIAIFEGLVFDENDTVLNVEYVGTEAAYVFNDHGFLRHIPAVEVDRQIFDSIAAQVKGHEDILSEQAAKMMGQEDPFTIAVIRNQLENQEKQFLEMQKAGLPADMRQYLAMVGFKAVVDFHGELKMLTQPSQEAPDGDE